MIRKLPSPTYLRAKLSQPLAACPVYRGSRLIIGRFFKRKSNGIQPGLSALPALRSIMPAADGAAYLLRTTRQS